MTSFSEVDLGLSDMSLSSKTCIQKRQLNWYPMQMVILFFLQIMVGKAEVQL